ncbi:DUF721 domain-containing protein [Capnocytophaga sp. ARDL2]|uniref:DUF721 domain-containing protein n=1 Tax=Capnocytophaga sp. ARDL2 TaxID=3238809 RepID=UPI003557C46E
MIPSKKTFNPDKRAHREQSANDILQMLIKGYHLESKLQELSIEDTWKEVLGVSISNYTDSIHLKKNVLYVKLSSAVLRQELSFGKDKIIKMLNEHAGKTIINELIFI